MGLTVPVIVEKVIHAPIRVKKKGRRKAGFVRRPQFGGRET